jgi:hypothetical protein
MDKMTPRERMLASFIGQPVDCFPVTAPYLMLTQSDHWTKLTGQPGWTFYEWNLKEPIPHLEEYQRFYELLPFDIAQPQSWELDRATRQVCRIEATPDGYYQVNTRAGLRHKLIENLHEKDQTASWPRTVFNKKDADERIPLRAVEDLIADGHLDNFSAYVQRWGKERFIAGTIVNSFYGSTWSVGLTNRFILLHDEPELMHYIIHRFTESNIREIQALAKAGCDSVFIDDATATNDMISVKMYQEFSMPYLKRQVEVIQNLGMKAILIYFGGITDRVEEILSAGADGLIMETSMKGYVNDLENIASQVNDRTLLFGNLNPIADLELASDEQFVTRLAAQIAIGKRLGRFVISTGSPLTPDTTLSRMQAYIRLGHELSAF